MITLKVGDIAPEFTLYNQNKKQIVLSDFRNQNNVLIYFYPKAMTLGCTTQSIELSNIKSELDSMNTIVLGISPDDPSRLKKFEERDSLTIQLLSDIDHEVAELFGVWGEKKFMGKVYDGIYRISFLINTEGEIIQVFKGFRTKDHHNIVLEYIKDKISY